MVDFFPEQETQTLQCLGSNIKNFIGWDGIGLFVSSPINSINSLLDVSYYTCFYKSKDPILDDKKKSQFHVKFLENGSILN